MNKEVRFSIKFVIGRVVKTYGISDKLAPWKIKYHLHIYFMELHCIRLGMYKSYPNKILSKITSNNTIPSSHLINEKTHKISNHCAYLFDGCHFTCENSLFVSKNSHACFLLVNARRFKNKLYDLHDLQPVIV